MRWFSLASLKALVSEITARENSNMQAVNDTFSEVYDNMETLDGRIDALEHNVEREQIPRCLEISREQAAQEQENQRTNTTLWHTEKRL